MGNNLNIPKEEESEEENKIEAEAAKFKEILEEDYDFCGVEVLESGRFSTDWPACGGGAGGFEGGNEEVNKAAPIEKKVLYSLEELYKGCKKRIKVSTIVLDDAGETKTVEQLLVIHGEPGWKKGTKITFPEKGNYEPGCTPGDLIFVVNEKPHALYKRDRNDLVTHHKISLLDALTGKTSLNLTTLDGRVLTIEIKDIIIPGQEFTVPDEGMPISKEPGKKGNLRIKFDIEFPSRLTLDQKFDLQRTLGRTAAE